MSSRLEGLARKAPEPPPTRRRRGGRRRVDETADLVAVVVQVAAALRSGAHPAQAWAEGLGAPVADGVPGRADLARRWPQAASGTAAVVAAARLTTRLGVSPAPVLDEVAAGLVRDAEAAAQRAAALAGPLATARLLAWLPAAGLLLGAALGAAPWTVLLDGGGGTALLLTGGLLTAAGRRWTAREVAAARSAAR